jgi:hypothetical protein
MNSKSSSSDSTDATRTLSHTANTHESSMSADTENVQQVMQQHKVKLESSRWTSAFANKKVCNCNFMYLQLCVLQYACVTV